jgi:peptidoglycan hydrolase CwlO-like protein
VVKQIASLSKSRQEMETQLQHMQQQMQQQMQQHKAQYEARIAQLTAENLSMKDKIEYLTNKISNLIKNEIQKRKDAEHAPTLPPQPTTNPPQPKDLGWYAKPNSSTRLDWPEFSRNKPATNLTT